MSYEMDGVGLLRSGGDHHHKNHEDRTGSSLSSSTTSVVGEDVGENSNGSSGSNEEGLDYSQLAASASSRDTEGTDKGREKSVNDCERSLDGIMSDSNNINGEHHHHHHHHHRSNHHHHSGSSHNPRANYCQFETPADESRGTFPDDFDEELFINMNTGQLVESRSAPSQFDADEEMDSSNSHVHNSHHGLNLDTADHSESSDIEDMYSVTPMPISERAAASDAVSTPTSSRVGNMAKVTNVMRRLSSSKELTGVVTVPGMGEDCGNAPETENNGAIIIAYRRSQAEPINQDAMNNCSDNNVAVPIRKRCLLVDESYNQDDTEDCSTNESEDNNVETTPAFFSTFIRKRKCLTEEPLPVKKAVTDSGLPDRDFVESDEDLHEDDNSSLASSPSLQMDTTPMLADWLTVFGNWNAVERVNAINHLIQASEPSEVRHMMRVIEPQFQRDFISLLPKELALYVLSFLEPKDLLQAAQTCRYWRILCDDSLLWKEKCREAGIGPFSAMAQRIHSRRSRGGAPVLGMLGVTRLGACPRASDNNCISSCEPWKAAYLRQHNVEMNWRFQPIKPTKTLKGHDDHVITCLQFSSNRIVSGSDDNTLKVWSATTGKCLRTLVGHTGGVWSSQMSGTTIVSGSTDRTLRVWNADTGACLHTLYGHTSTVRCMHLFERKVVSGSRDATLRVWNVDSGECLHVLVGHMAAVRCVQYNGKIVVSGAYDFMVRVWDVEREECLHQLSGHSNRVYSLQFDGVHVVSGSLDTSIRVWDVKTGTCKHTLMGHQSLTSGMELRDNLLVSGNADSTVKIWDINTGQCLLTLSGSNKHLSAVTCLQLINKFVITSSDDGTVKLWDISTGDFVRNLVTLSSGGSGGVVWRIRASETKLVCAVGSRNGTEETKLLVLDFDVDTKHDDGMKDASTSTSPMKSVQNVG